jgi:hypothetical protein
MTVECFSGKLWGNNPEREIRKLQFLELLVGTWMKTAILRLAVARFTPTKCICLTQMPYHKSSSPQAHFKLNRGQERPPESNNEEVSKTPKEAALICSA